MGPDLRAAGRDLGSRYVLLEVIGQGSSGVVWQAVEHETGEHLAAKILRHDLAEMPGMGAAFLAEAEVLRSVRHPHVLAVRDVVAEGGELALVLDLVRGPSLRAVLEQRGPLGVTDAGAIAAQLAAGLAAVHAVGIVHADLKPENILLDARGVRLADFGLARIRTRTMTTTGGGTPGYLAPELRRAAQSTPAADVFAMGRVLYEALTGELPRKTVLTAADRSRLASTAGGDSPELARAILDALATDPRRRPAARTLARRLAGVLGPGASELDEPGDGGEVGAPTRQPGRLGCLPTTVGVPHVGPLLEQYAGDSRPTVLHGLDLVRRPDPVGTVGVATSDYRRRRRRHTWRGLAAASAAIALGAIGIFAYANAIDTGAADASDRLDSSHRMVYPVPTGWLCGASSTRRLGTGNLQVRACVLGDSSGRAIGRIGAVLTPRAGRSAAEPTVVDLRVRLVSVDEPATALADAGCVLTLMVAKPADACPSVGVTPAHSIEIMAIGTGQAASEPAEAQVASTPAVMIRSQRVS